MKKLELLNFGVQEMDCTEMLLVDGGSWIGRVWNSVKEFVLDIVHDVVTDLVGVDPTTNK